jgi:hypothetical protein
MYNERGLHSIQGRISALAVTQPQTPSIPRPARRQGVFDYSSVEKPERRLSNECQEEEPSAPVGGPGFDRFLGDV